MNFNKLERLKLLAVLVDLPSMPSKSCLDVLASSVGLMMRGGWYVPTGNISSIKAPQETACKLYNIIIEVV